MRARDTARGRRPRGGGAAVGGRGPRGRGARARATVAEEPRSVRSGRSVPGASLAEIEEWAARAHAGAVRRPWRPRERAGAARRRGERRSPRLCSATTAAGCQRLARAKADRGEPGDGLTELAPTAYGKDGSSGRRSARRRCGTRAGGSRAGRCWRPRGRGRAGSASARAAVAASRPRRSPRRTPTCSAWHSVSASLRTPRRCDRLVGEHGDRERRVVARADLCSNATR